MVLLLFSIFLSSAIDLTNHSILPKKKPQRISFSENLGSFFNTFDFAKKKRLRGFSSPKTWVNYLILLTSNCHTMVTNTGIPDLPRSDLLWPRQPAADSWQLVCSADPLNCSGLDGLLVLAFPDGEGWR